MTPTFKALTPAGEWVEGWFDYSDKTDPVIWMPDGETGTTIRVLSETVCMATGRPDSKGKMMYEGDFVQVDAYKDGGGLDRSGIYRIEYDNLSCAFKLMHVKPKVNQSKYIDFIEFDTHTLTGKNIHDKPLGGVTH